MKQESMRPTGIEFLRKCSARAVSQAVPKDLVRRIEFTNFYSIIFGLIVAFYGALFNILGIHPLDSLTLLFTFAFWSALYLNYEGHTTASRFVVLINQVIVIYSYSVSFGKDSGVFFWFIVSIQTPFILFELKERKYLVASFTLVVGSFLFLWETNFRFGLLPIAVINAEKMQIISIAMILISMLTGYLIMFHVALNYLRASRRQSELEKTLQLYAQALDESCIVAITDRRGNVIHANDNFCRTSGYTREELVGESHRIVNSGYHERELFLKMWSTLDAKKVWKGEICNRSKSGSVYWVDTTILPILDENGSIEKFIAIHHDITQRKNAEVQLVQSAKMASLGEMAGGIAHEINNPLAIIQGRAYQLEKRLNELKCQDNKLQNITQGILSMVERISKIILGLKTFARDGSQDPFIAKSLISIIDESLSLCTEKFRLNGIPIEVRYAKVTVENSVIECRPVQLTQVFINLLNNAYDAICNLSEKWVRVDVSSNDSAIQILVTDSGGGIAPHIAERIMQPFFTSKEVGKGTGLGLSISKGIIESHGGLLRLVPCAKNTQFLIEIPMIQGVRKRAVANFEYETKAS